MTFSNSTVKGSTSTICLPTPASLCNQDNEKDWVTISGFAHLLLFYRLEPSDLPDFGSGGSMLKALTDERTARQIFGKSPFVRTRNGLRYLLLKKDPLTETGVGEAHRDQCLATFGDLDLPLNTSISLESTLLSISDLLRESISSFDIDESEPSWTTLAYVKYLPPNYSWTNRFGERFTFSQLAQHLAKVDLNSQSCGGTHIFEALIRLSNADNQFHILDKKTRALVNSYLRLKVDKIIVQQHSDGSWSKNWSGDLNDNSADSNPIESQLLVTGHLLQMLLELNRNLRPQLQVYIKAANWISSRLNQPRAIGSDVSWLCPFTHAALSAKTTFANSNLQKEHSPPVKQVDLEKQSN